ncbi:MAG: DivIVA domain-containing protein [Actinomycetota bacterium]
MARKKKQQKAEETGFGEQATGQRSRLTPIDIQQRVFRLAFRGYNERDVDEFLDHVTEDLAALHEENKRLREGLGGGGSEDLEAARNQAETIVREAREHAARLIEEAGGQPTAAGGGLSSSFLLRERDFLQKLAHSVQDHARWLKEEAQRQRTSGGVTNAAATVKGGRGSGSSKKSRGSGSSAKSSAAAGEATAAWGPPQQDMAEPSGGLNREQTPGEADPLLAAWESAFTAKGQEGKSDKEGEPSLRELFWGEE